MSFFVKGHYQSKNLVTALNLTTQPHPNPYKVNWITKKGETSIKDQIVWDILEIVYVMFSLKEHGNI